jgi:hypothetical protein
MDRRGLLAALGAGLAGLAGCSAIGSDPDPAPVTPAPVPEDAPGRTTPDRELQPERDPEPTGASVVEFPGAGLTASLYPTSLRTQWLLTEVSFLGGPSENGPARVAVRLTNAGDRPGGFRFGVTPTDRDAGPVLVPTESHPGVDPEVAPELERDSDGCWRLVEPEPSLPLAGRVMLPPGGSLSGEYALVARAGAGCPPPGRYGFGDDQRPLTLAVWPTETPGPATESRLAGRSVPSIGPGTVWYHEAGPATPVFVRPDSERERLPGSIRFRLINRSRDGLDGNGWGLYKLVEGRWYPIRPTVFDEFSRTVPPGDELDWSFRFLNRRPDPRAVAQLPVSAGPVGGGTYGFAPDYHRDGAVYAALFELEGPAVRVSPVSSLSVERADGRVEAVSPSAGDPPWTLRFTPTDQAPTLRLIPEQLMQPRYRVFRNSLPLFDGDGTTTVRLRTDRAGVEAALGRNIDETIVAYQGRRYAVGVRPP